MIGMSNLVNQQQDIVFYSDEDETFNVEVLIKDEDVWLNAESIAKLFKVGRPAITKQINNIYNDQELEENSTCSILEHMGNRGNQKYKTKYYNLDMIISLGFRVNSKIAIKFRTWANKLLKDYIVKGYNINED